MMRRAWLALLIALAACGHSPPTHYFTLDPVPGATATLGGAPVRVGAIRIPPDLDRVSMVRETAPNQLDVDDQNRWSGPLDALVRVTLARDLRQRLPAGMVIMPETPEVAGVRTVTVAIAVFEPGPAGTVTLEATWSLLAGTPAETVIRHGVHLADASPAAAPAAPAAQAAAMSRLVGRLADAIVEGLKAAP